MAMRRLTYLACFIVLGMASAPMGCSNGDSSDGTSSWLCRVDDDCTGGLVCNEGTCVEPGDDTPEPILDAGSEPVEPPLPTLCTEGEPGCTCGWSEAERVGDWGPSSRKQYEVAEDGRGGAVIAWEEPFSEDIFPPLPLSTRSLDPATETWSERTLVFDSVGDFVFEHDSAGNLLVLAGYEVPLGVIQPGIHWTRYDSVARAWDATAELDPIASLVRSRVMTSPSGTTYLWAWPVDDAGPLWMRSFDGTGWTLGEGSEAIRTAAIEIDQQGNALATWDGFLETPGQFAQWYDAATRTWGEVERLDIPGVSWHGEQLGDGTSSIAFDAEGNAHVYWVEADYSGSGWIRTRRAETATWTEPEPVVYLSMLPSGRIFADSRGEVHIAGMHCDTGSSETACSAAVARYDATAKEWRHRVLMEHIGLEGFAPGVYVENGETMFLWGVSDRESTSPPSFWTSQLGPDGDWSEPTEMPAVDWGNAPTMMKLGAGGRAIVVWREVSSDPGPVPLRLFASRYERATGWGLPEVVYEPSSDPMYVADAKVALDSRGYATAVWGMEDGETFDPGLLKDEVRVSRWACRPTGE